MVIRVTIRKYAVEIPLLPFRLFAASTLPSMHIYPETVGGVLRAFYYKRFGMP